jgi:hypothetical protein
MNRPISLSSLSLLCSLSFVLGACGGVSEGSSTTNDGDQEALRRADPDLPVAEARAPTPPPRRPPVVFFPGPVATVVYDPGPPNADLRPDGAMRYYGPAEPTLGLQIDVVNVGTTPAYGPSSHVNIEGSVFSAVLYQYYGGTATAANTVNPGERGYLKADVPPSLLLPCLEYQVQIDLDHTMQSGTGVFDNDTRTVLPYETGLSCKLNWSTPINGATLGQEPDQHDAGKSLQDIVSSIEIARIDGNRCSTCHNSGTNPTSNNIPEVYRPNVAAGVPSAPIDPFLFIGGNEGWACGGSPWAEKFIAVPANASYAKPQYLKDAFQKWLSDGGMR